MFQLVQYVRDDEIAALDRKRQQAMQWLREEPLAWAMNTKVRVYFKKKMLRQSLGLCELPGDL